MRGVAKVLRHLEPQQLLFLMAMANHNGADVVAQLNRKIES